MKKKIISLATAVVMLFSIAVSSNAAVSSKTWNLYYTNAPTGNHTVETASMTDSALYIVDFSTLGGPNSSKSVRVSISGQVPAGKSNSVSYNPLGVKRQYIEAVYLGVNRTATMQLYYASNTGTVSSTGTIFHN